MLWKLRSRVVSTERTILSPFTKEYRVLSTPCGIRLFLEGLKGPPFQFKFQNSRSRVVSTERTILSPFTKEYRVLSTPCGIRLFLEGLNTPKPIPSHIARGKQLASPPHVFKAA
ncbi:hypothetical protein GQ457_02G017380 [Hibiscus cannabinus]